MFGVTDVLANELHEVLAFCCAPGRIRTCDTHFRRVVLYPLSY
jgi:hypothetical protein